MRKINSYQSNKINKTQKNFLSLFSFLKSPFSTLFSQTSTLSSRSGFTLMEIIVAVLIFAMMTIMIIMTLTAFYGSRSKNTVVRNAQQESSFALENIANSAKGGNRKSSDSNYYGFAIFDSGGIIDTSLDAYGLYEGPILKTSYQDTNGNIAEKVFKLSDPDGDCNASGNCQILMQYRQYNGTPTSFSAEYPLTSPDIDVTNLKFTGVHRYGTCPVGGSNCDKQPFVMIDVKLQSQYQGGGKKYEEEKIQLITSVANGSLTFYF